MNLLRTYRKLIIPRYTFQSLNDTSALSEELIQIQTSALQFAREKLQPFAQEWDQKQHFPIDVHREAAQQGYAAIYVSPEYGGCGLDRLSASVIFEALAYGCVPTSAYLSIQNMCLGMIDQWGTEQQKSKWMPRLATMELFASYCLTEPDSGSDSRSMKSHARQDGTDFVLNGNKCFISGGSVSDLYVVMCKTNENEVSVLLVEKGMKGLTFGKKERKMGWNSSTTTQVMFDNVRVPQENLLGKRGDGFKMAMKGLDGGRINIGSCSLGGAQHAFDRTKQYMTERKQFGKLLKEQQYLQFKLADMATSLTSSRLMLRNAARMLDIDHPDKTMYISMAKRYSTDACSQVADQAIQLHGGYGYLADYHVERIVRDLRVNQILEGTNEMMRLIISRALFK